MTIPEKTAEKKTCPSKWLFIASGLTIAYIVFLLLVADVTVDIRDACHTASKPAWVSEWFGCLTMNELGDFLAGAFAPLAFIWLAAAVLIQSQELKAQRTELMWTRLEFEKNREVMKAQVGYIGEQTKILEREQQTREDAERVRIFEAAVENLAIRMLDANNWASFVHQRISTFNRIKTDVIVGENHESENVVRKMSNFYRQNHINTQLSKIEKNSLNSTYPDEFKAVYYACERADIIAGSLPHDARINMETMKLHELMEQLRWFVEYADNLHDVIDG